MLCCVLLAAADRSRGHMSHPWSSSTTSNKLGCRVLFGGWSIRRWAVVRQAQAVLAGALCATRARQRGSGWLSILLKIRRCKFLTHTFAHRCVGRVAPMVLARHHMPFNPAGTEG